MASLVVPPNVRFRVSAKLVWELRSRNSLSEGVGLDRLVELGWPESPPSAYTIMTQPLKMIRPNPGWNEVLVFSPYLIHGGGRNFATDATRISLEMRLFRGRER